MKELNSYLDEQTELYENELNAFEMIDANMFKDAIVQHKRVLKVLEKIKELANK